MGSLGTTELLICSMPFIGLALIVILSRAQEKKNMPKQRARKPLSTPLHEELKSKQEDKPMFAQISIDLPMVDVFVHLLLWAILAIFTLGIALLFYPYAGIKFILEAITFDDGDRIYRLACDFGAGAQIGHIIIWGLIIICTAGLASLFYPFDVVRVCIKNSEMTKVR